VTTAQHRNNNHHGVEQQAYEDTAYGIERHEHRGIDLAIDINQVKEYIDFIIRRSWHACMHVWRM
jgi:hypothetical protein